MMQMKRVTTLVAAGALALGLFGGAGHALADDVAPAQPAAAQPSDQLSPEQIQAVEQQALALEAKQAEVHDECGGFCWGGRGATEESTN